MKFGEPKGDSRSELRFRFIPFRVPRRCLRKWFLKDKNHSAEVWRTFQGLQGFIRAWKKRKKWHSPSVRGWRIVRGTISAKTSPFGLHVSRASITGSSRYLAADKSTIIASDNGRFSGCLSVDLDWPAPPLDGRERVHCLRRLYGNLSTIIPEAIMDVSVPRTKVILSTKVSRSKLTIIVTMLIYCRWFDATRPQPVFSCRSAIRTTGNY